MARLFFGSKKGVFFGLSLAGAFLGSMQASSQELAWRMTSARSTGVGSVSCDMNSVTMIDAGTSMSLLFDNMRAILPGGDKRGIRTEAALCVVSLDVTIPQGYYLASADSSVTAGVEKSRGATAHFGSAMFLLGTPILTKARIFEAKDVMSLPLVILNERKDFPRPQMVAICQRTKFGAHTAKMIVHVAIGASRVNEGQTSIMEVDAADTSFSLGLSLGRCGNVR